MSEQELDFGALRDEINQSDSEASDSDDDEQYDTANAIPCARTVGTVAVGWDSIEAVTYHGSTIDNEGNPIVEQDGDVSVVFNNPRVMKGTAFENAARAGEDDDVVARELDDGPYLDFKIVDDTDDDVEKTWNKDGEMKGIKGCRTNEFESVESSLEGLEQLRVYLSGTTGRKVAQALDKNGAIGANWVAHEGSVINNHGLIEFHPEYSNYDVETPYPRFARFPQVRDDVADKEGFMLIGRRSFFDPDYSDQLQYRGYAYTGTSMSDKEEIEPTAVSLDEVEETVHYEAVCAWHDEDDVDVSSVDSEETEGEQDFDLDADDGNTSDDQSTAGNPEGLTATGQKFAEKVVEKIEDTPVDVAFDDFGKTIEANQDSDNHDLTHADNEGDIRAYIESRQ